MVILYCVGRLVLMGLVFGWVVMWMVLMCMYG